MADIPENAPDHCPGTESEEAGKANACAGCPNQKICSSGEARLPDPDSKVIQERLLTVRNKLLILSGKGGVGKSTISAMISRSLALHEDHKVGILDVDICGPSQPRILGVQNEEVHVSGSGLAPICADKLSIMSIGFLLHSPEDAVIWRGPKKNGMIKKFLMDVDWGDLDYLVIDTPPGTSDEHLSLVQFLSNSANTAAIIVSTPQEVALLDVRKEITFCNKVNIPIVGIVENMSSFLCPKCKVESIIFPSTTGGAKSLSEEFHIPFLGSLPLDPKVAKACDEGINIIEEEPDALSTSVYLKIAGKIQEYFDYTAKQ